MSFGFHGMTLLCPARYCEGMQNKCERCNGTGIATWGGTINGKPVHSGKCFRCQGKGYQSEADKRRNYGYDNFYMRVNA